MLTLFINPNLGFTMNTLPEGMFNIMQSIDVGSDNTIQVVIEDNRLEEAREILSDAYTGFVNFNQTGSIVKVDIGAEPAEPEDHGIEIEEEGNEEEELDERDDAPEIEIPPAGQAVPRENEPGQDAPIQRNTMIEPSVVRENIIEDNNQPYTVQVYALIAQAVGGESVNLAKQLDEAIRQFNIHFNKALALKRQVDSATQRFTESSPEIINLVEQANTLAEQYELVERVYFTNEELVFITIPLITDDRWDGHRRLIGSMRIGIALEALFSPNPTSDNNAISIKNLTHRYVSGSGRIWECGHFDSQGRSCFGTAFNAIFDAIVSRDLTYIIESLIRFIKSPNPNDSWGSHMKYWPIAPIEEE